MDKPNPETLESQSQLGILTAGSRPYLGDPVVVCQVLRTMLDDAIMDDDPDSVRDAVEDAVLILTGQDPDYAPMGKWNTGEGLGNWIRGTLGQYMDPPGTFRGIPPAGGNRTALEFALGLLVLLFIGAASRVATGAETPEQSGTKMAQTLRNWTYMMVGVPVVLVPRVS